MKCNRAGTRFQAVSSELRTRFPPKKHRPHSTPPVGASEGGMRQSDAQVSCPTSCGEIGIRSLQMGLWFFLGHKKSFVLNFDEGVKNDF